MSHSGALDREHKSSSQEARWSEGHEADPRWLLAQRVAASRAFVRSRLLGRFLLYIVGETLEGRQASITEHRIGVCVFERPASYSSIQDNIVRTYARQLRRRLAEYFSSEGLSESLRIEIPVGGYIPVFVAPPAAEHESPVPAMAPADLPEPDLLPVPELPVASEQTGSKPSKWITGGLFVLYSLLLIGVSWYVSRRVTTLQTTNHGTDATSPLWKALFGGPANCYIVPADAGFNLLEELAHKPLPITDYMQGSYLDLPLAHIDGHSAEDLKKQQFTSFTDLRIVAALAHRPEFNAQRAIVRFPRDLKLDDLKNANAIILGSMSSNPWAALAGNTANFRILNRDGMEGAVVVNAKPQPGEALTYQSEWNQPAHQTYAVIEYLPNLDNTGHILLLQGLDVAGTEAAAEALMHSAAIEEILKEAVRPNGALRPFEILLRATSIDSKSTGTQIIGSRVY